MECVAVMDRPAEPEDLADSRTDAELVAAVNAGEADAFEVLYRRYRDWTVGLAYRFTGDEALALDVLQDTFLYVLKKSPGFQLTAQFKTFLYPAIRNLALAARRKAARSQASASDLEALENAAAPEPVTGDASALGEVLALLTEEHREVLHLRFVENLKLGEIAEAMNLPLGTVKSRLHYALEFLRQDPRTRNFLET